MTRTCQGPSERPSPTCRTTGKSAWPMATHSVSMKQGGVFFRSKLWRMVGPLDPSFYYAMDYDLWVRIAEVSPIALYRRPWANFRIHGTSKSLTAANRCWPEMVRVHFRDGGSIFSGLYLKYLIRRLVEPLMPLRMKYRFWRYSRSNRHS